jgi:hypothetical protein
MERTTTILVYAADRDWLQEKQREISFKRQKTIPMCDLIRELVDALKRAEEGA